MAFLLNRFNEKYIKQTFLNVKFFDENPLTIRRIRYNQSGAVCYCMANSSKAKQKVDNKWQDIECTSDCQYCIRTEKSNKPACNYEGTLKFMLPEISQDRIWIMKITGQQSITNLEEYINFQKYLGNSLKGNYTIFLTKIEQTNSEGKKFNNFVIDIAKSDDFNSNDNLISQTDIQTPIISTENTQNVDNSTSNQTKKRNKQADKSIKQTQTNSVQVEKDAKVNSSVEQPQNSPEIYKEHCFLYDIEYKTFQKAGKDTEYLIAKITNENDELTDVIIKPEFKAQMEKCDIGTELIIELQKFKNNVISRNIEFVNLIPKKVAA